jgi:hypothetical protein
MSVTAFLLGLSLTVLPGSAGLTEPLCARTGKTLRLFGLNFKLPRPFMLITLPEPSRLMMILKVALTPREAARLLKPLRPAT